MSLVEHCHFKNRIWMISVSSIVQCPLGGADLSTLLNLRMDGHRFDARVGRVAVDEVNRP